MLMKFPAHNHTPALLKSIPEIWTSLEQLLLQTASRDFHRSCHILLLSSFLGGHNSVYLVGSGGHLFLKYMVRYVFQAHFDFIVPFNDSHAVIFNLASHSTLWCQQPPIQIMKTACETVIGECKHKLGSDVDCWAPGRTEGAFSHPPGLSHLEETPTKTLSFKCLSIGRGTWNSNSEEEKVGMIGCTEVVSKHLCTDSQIGNLN